MLAARVRTSVASTALRERPLLHAARDAHADPSEFAGDPLVSVTIATWNRGEILAGRTLPSILAQTYRNLEIVIVGDCCTDDTAELVAAIADGRVRFVNLPERGVYPTEPFARHCVAGSVPIREARSLARGAWIAHCDDDEVWLPTHLETLLREAQRADAELIWGRARYEISPGEWRVEGSRSLDLFDIPHSTVMFRSYLRLFAEDMECWRVGLGADRHRFRRMRACGVRAAFVDEIVTHAPLRPGTTKPWVESEDREVISGAGARA